MILRLFAYCFTAIATLGLLWALGWMWFAANTVSMQPQGAAQKSDAIIVLTGGDKRVNTGLDLLEAGLADKLFISGVHSSVTARELIGLWDGEKEKLLPAITLGYVADNTAGNAVESHQWIAENNIHSIRLVTANYHMARSYLMFRQAMPELAIYKHPVFPG
ncbi:MAG: YdcF family protein, partial [Micavibrio sp.]